MQIIHQAPLAALGLGAAFTVVWGVADPVAAFAEVSTYTGVGKCVMGDLVSPAQAKNYAREMAMQNAKEQAGVYLANYTRTTNTRLTENEITAITNNITELVGEVSYTQIPGEVNGVPVVVYTATLQVNVDTEGIRAYLGKDEKVRVNIVSQSKKSRQDINVSLTKIEQLNQAYNEAGSVQEKERIEREFNVADKKLQAGQKLEEGNALYYNGDYDGAIRLYDEALVLYPEYDDAYTNRGAAYAMKNDYDRAIADFDRALSINPKDAGTYNNRGNAYAKKGDYDRALSDYDCALGIDSGLADVYNNRATVYCDEGDYDRAIADCNRALALNPQFAEAYNNRALAYRRMGNYDRAIADYSRALELNPMCAEAYSNRSVAYRRQGDYDRAIADCDRALSLNPNDAQTYINRGNAYRDKGDADRAVADYTRAVSLNPQLVNAYYNRGAVYYDKGDYDRAIADWRKCLALQPDDDEVKTNIQLAEAAKRG